MVALDMDGTQYDARILDAAMRIKGAPPEAARKTAAAFARVSRGRKVSGEGPAPRWYEVQARVAAARKVLTDAIDAWQNGAKTAARDAVNKVRDAVDGALQAARAAGSAMASTWEDVRAEVDKVIGTIGGAAVGGAVGGLLVMAALAFVLFKGASRA